MFSYTIDVGDESLLEQQKKLLASSMDDFKSSLWRAVDSKIITNMQICHKNYVLI